MAALKAEEQLTASESRSRGGFQVNLFYLLGDANNSKQVPYKDSLLSSVTLLRT